MYLITEVTKHFENMLQEALGPKVFRLLRHVEIGVNFKSVRHIHKTVNTGNYTCFSSLCTIITVIKIFDRKQGN